MRPQSIYISNPHTLSRYYSSRNYLFSLPRPRIDIVKTSISFSGVWNNLPLTIRSCQSLSSFSENVVHTLKQLHRMDCDRILLGREREGERQAERQTDRQTETDNGVFE